MINLRPPDGLRLVLAFSDHDEGFVVQIVDSPHGRSAAVPTRLQRLEDLRRVVSQRPFHEDVGRGLYRALFPGELAERVTAVFTQAAVSGQTLTLELRFNPATLRAARYPWELLHDGTRFLVQSGVHLTRTLPYPEPLRPAAPRPGPLEVLLVAAHPDEQPLLARGYDALQRALEEPGHPAQLDLAYLLPPTWDALMDWLLAGPPGVLQFEGHATLTRLGRLLFETASGMPDPVDADLLAGVFHSAALPLMVLTSSAAAGEGGDALLNDAAPWLILGGIPAAVAAQGHFGSEAAADFLRAFYDALLAEKSLEESVAQGRQAIAHTPYWHLPTLYRRTLAGIVPSQEARSWRADTAAPQTARPGYPLRAALWLRAPGAPLLASETVERVVGLAPDPIAPPPARLPALAPLRLTPGPVEIRLSAPHCEIHGPARQVVWLAAGFEPPPAWFVVTPRAAPVALAFTLWQGSKQVGSVTHDLAAPLDATEHPCASVITHGAPAPTLPLLSEPISVPPAPPPPLTIAPPPAPNRPAPAVPEPPRSPLDDTAVRTALDEALDWVRRPVEAAPDAPDEELPEPPDDTPRASKGWRRFLLPVLLVVGLASGVTAAVLISL